MNEKFCPLSGAEERQSLHLQELGYQCATLEEELLSVAESLPATQRAVIEEYIALRNMLEVESIRAAIRFGERQTIKK